MNPKLYGELVATFAFYPHLQEQQRVGDAELAGGQQVHVHGDVHGDVHVHVHAEHAASGASLEHKTFPGSTLYEQRLPN